MISQTHDQPGPALDWLEKAFGNAAFEPLKLRGTPLLVLAGDPLSLTWANIAASDAFSARDNVASARLIFGSAGEARQRLETLRRRLAPESPPRLERIRVARGLAVHNVTVLCCRADTPVGTGLAMAIPGLTSNGKAAAHWWQAHGEPDKAMGIGDSGVIGSAGTDAPEHSAPAIGDPIEDLRPRLRAAFGGRDQRRFLWRTDAAGRLAQVDDSLFDDLGAIARPLLQHSLTYGIDAFDPGGAKRLQEALDTRASWSGIEIEWPIGEGHVSIPVTLGAASQFGAGRAFDGFRGFGVADVARLAASTRPFGETFAARRALALPPAAPAELGPASIPAAADLELALSELATRLQRLDLAPQEAWTAGPEHGRPADSVDPGGDLPSPARGPAEQDGAAFLVQELDVEPASPFQYVDGQANVVRLWPAPGGPGRAPATEQGPAASVAKDDPGRNGGSDPAVAETKEFLPERAHQGDEGNGSLTSSEHSAFREIALVLGADPDDVPAGPRNTGTPDHADTDASAQAVPSSLNEPIAAGVDLPGGDDLRRHSAGIVAGLPLGLLVLRGTELLYANRALLDALRCSRITDLPPALAGDLAQGRDAGEARVTVNLPIADGTRVALVAEGSLIDWDGGAAALWLLRPASDGDVRTAAPEAPAEARGSDARQLGALVDAASDAIATIDDAGRILTLNRQGEKWFGHDRRRLAGESFTQLLAPESRATAAALLAEVKASDDPGAELARETLARAPDGTSLPLQMALARIGTGVFSAAWRDLSAQKRLERDMTRAKREADRASSQQPEFLAKVSHEIRTPLNAILGFAEIMIDERFGPLGNARYKDYLRDIHMSGTQVMNLVNDLLDLSRIEAGRLDLDLAPVDLNRVIGECVAEMQTQAHRERVIMRTSLGARLPAITADQKSVRQIVGNLLSNAIRFNEPGGQVIVSSAINDAGAVVVRIKDTGVGMSDTDIAAALEPFRQLSASKQAGGTGLGLPLTKALAGANGASLSIRSRPREGTMVEVTFLPAPAAAARVPA